MLEPANPHQILIVEFLPGKTIPFVRLLLKWTLIQNLFVPLLFNRCTQFTYPKQHLGSFPSHVCQDVNLFFPPRAPSFQLSYAAFKTQRLYCHFPRLPQALLQLLKLLSVGATPLCHRRCTASKCSSLATVDMDSRSFQWIHADLDD